MLGLETDWCVVKTARFKEAYVKVQITEVVGAEAYLPMAKIPKQILRTGQAQFEPVFPGYLFVRFDLTTQMLALRRLHAFHSLVCFDGRPAFVEQKWIDDLKRRERGRGYINLHTPKEPFQANESVRVVDGPFSGHRGLFVRNLDGAQRVCILLDILRTGVRLELPLYAVAAAGTARDTVQ